MGRIDLFTLLKIPVHGHGVLIGCIQKQNQFLYVYLVSWKFDGFFNKSSIGFCKIFVIFCAHSNLEIEDSLKSFFPICWHFISFSCLLALAKTSIHTIFLYLIMKAFSFSKLHLLLALWFFCRCPLSSCATFHLLVFSECFKFWMGMEFCQMFLLHLLIWLYDFSSLDYFYHRLHDPYMLAEV